MAAQRLDWDRDGLDWPHREASRFIDAGGLSWHVQWFAREGRPGFDIDVSPGAAPVALLLHGTGASSHSWLPMVPWLRRHFDLLSIDLPGHAFTSMATPWQASLPGMAQAVRALLQAMDLRPGLVVGHSAGAALGARLCLDSPWPGSVLVSLNGAFLPLGGLAGVVFPPVARLMASLSFAPGFVARRSTDRGAIERLVNGTGSRLDATGTALYARLVGNPGHVAGALAMMANWDLRPLMHDLPKLRSPLTLVAAERDLAVPPAQARAVVELMRGADPVTLISMSGVGHLAHEEEPEAVTAHCLAAARAGGLIAA